jgi:hypothetical protein
MSIYALTIAILLLFSYVEISGIGPTKNRAMLFIIFLILVAQIGLRWETGTDWTPYRTHFEQEHTWDSVFLNVFIGYELGYGIFVWLIHSISDNYTVFLLIHAIIFYILIFKASNRLSNYPILAMLLFYAVMIGFTGSNRQLMAVAICLYSLIFASNKKLMLFLLCVFIAALFHTSALIFSIYYLLNRDLKKQTIFTLITISMVMGFSSIPSSVFTIIAGFFGETFSYKADFYLDVSNRGPDELSVFGLIRRVIVLFIGLYFYNSIIKRAPIFRVLFNGYLMGLILYFMFANSLLILVSRGSLYFGVMEAFILASVPVAMKDDLSRKITLVALFLYSITAFYQSISTYADLFIPYKSIFINTHYERTLY